MFTASCGRRSGRACCEYPSCSVRASAESLLERESFDECARKKAPEPPTASRACGSERKLFVARAALAPLRLPPQRPLAQPVEPLLLRLGTALARLRALAVEHGPVEVALIIEIV